MLATFDLLYKNAWLYWLASTIPFAGQWRTWQRLVLPRLQGHDVLEVGCGPGWLLGDMIAAGYRCMAIDASPQMVATTRRTLRRHGIADAQAIVQQARAQSLPFTTASFDCVVSTFPAPYISDVATLHEIARVLRPGGRLIIVEGASLQPRGPILRLLVAIERIVYGSAVVEGPPDVAQREALARRIPLAEAGMTAAQDVVSGPFWYAYICIGTKDPDVY